MVGSAVIGSPTIGEGGAGGASEEEIGSNVSITGRNEALPMMTINCRVPAYTAFLDDGSRLEFESQDYVVQVHDTDVYTMFSLLAEIRNKTKWGACQEPTFWYWDVEKKGLQVIETDVDLNMAFSTASWCHLLLNFLFSLLIRVA